MPREFLCDLPGNIYPLRTRSGTLTLLARADKCATKTEAYKILLKQSIRNVPVSLTFCHRYDFWYVFIGTDLVFLNFFKLLFFTWD